MSLIKNYRLHYLNQCFKAFMLRWRKLVQQHIFQNAQQAYYFYEDAILHHRNAGEHSKPSGSQAGIAKTGIFE